MGSAIGGIVQDVAGIAGTALGGPVGGALGSIAGQALGSLLGGSGAGGAGGIGGGGDPLGGILQSVEQAFQGLFGGGQQAQPSPGFQFPQFPQPFQAPPFANNPFGAFGGSQGGQGGGGGLTPGQLTNIGNQVDGLQNQAQNLLQNANGNQAMILQAQQDMQKSDELFQMTSQLLKQQHDEALKAISNMT